MVSRHVGISFIGVSDIDHPLGSKKCVFVPPHARKVATAVNCWHQRKVAYLTRSSRAADRYDHSGPPREPISFEPVRR